MFLDTHEHTHAHDMASVGAMFLDTHALMTWRHAYDTHEHTHAHDMASVGATFLDITHAHARTHTTWRRVLRHAMNTRTHQ
jgi:hypothetical protein